MPQIVKDMQGVEYTLIKANPKNWIVERRSDGRRMKGDARIFTPVRVEADTTPPINPMFRIGAIVNLLPDCPIVTDPRNSHKAGDFFVIIGFGQAPGEFRIIEAGGNDRNQYYKSIPARYLTVEDD